MSPTIVWTFRGERQFHFLLSRLNRLPERVGILAGVTERLRLVFPDAIAVVVRDLYLGFRPRRDEYTLLVDVRYAEEGEGGTRVVKLADDHRLRLEYDAWLHTKEPQFNGDGMLMRQTAAYHPQYRHQTVGIVYQDATTHIGMSRQVFLEEAFIGAVRHDSPTVDSVIGCFDQLFRSLSRELYAGRHRHREVFTARLELNPSTETPEGTRRSLTAPMRWEGDAPVRQADGTMRMPTESVLSRWSNATYSPVVQEVDNWTSDVRLPFRNPIDFFVTARRVLTANPNDTRFAIPLTRGPAHGDLHGRNILVGIEDDRADRPATYDYEHMHRENLILLDFAKLETELKVRAYPYLFDLERRVDYRPESQVIAKIHDLEHQLARDGRNEYQPLVPSARHPDMEARLFRLLKGLRHLAWDTNPRDTATQQDWNREYQLLLAAYGVYSLRFGQPTLCQAVALISAGTSAASFLS